MPGNLKNTKPNRPIKSDLKSYRIIWETEHPIRWSYMKILREFSTLKKVYPINPFCEVYQMRDNLYCIFNESFDGAGDVWMFLIDGPEKAMLIDTSFGVGDLKGLCRELVGDKPLVVVNTHFHYDHCYGNAQFEKCYCYEDEAFNIQTTNNPHIWDYLFDENGNGIYAGGFTKEDIIDWHEYQIIGVPANTIFDLGEGYEVELIPLVGHSSGQAGYLDKNNRILFTGDVTGIGGRVLAGDPHPENCTVEAMCECFRKIWARHDEYDGVFPSHGTLDQTNTVVKYHLDALEAILKDPENANEKKVIEHADRKVVSYLKYIYQGTAVRYSPERVYKEQVLKASL
ncbi:MAG: MBL fold metallo-hydrolase [Lachnospiraceae bacterium]|nr:MBL fold metallo-hydrolase [Lachnospiraceae bacterium]